AFFSHPCEKPDWDEYAEKIIDEISHWSEKLGKIYVPTIFFGGGTPSLMPVNIFKTILSKIYSCFDVLPNAEITLESNPGTLDAVKLSDFCANGVTRLSIGVQSLDDSKLKFLGRRHTAYDALKLIDCANQQNVRVSGDFIYGLPHETPDDIRKICQQINSLGLTHCSMYELTIEKNTPFGKINLDMPDNKTMAEMYIAIQENLNLPRYEVSNYATADQHCIHNENIWDSDAYIGLGPGAAGRVFFNNTWYEQLGNNALFSAFTPNELAIEKVLTGMRTARGTKLTPDVYQVINMGFAKSETNMLRFTDDNRIVATDAGILVLDNLLTKLVK
nr:coproporphyrinogen III oxidase family protein [Alphaproteobacteria bacterium]